MDENSTPSSVLVLSQGLGFTMYTSAFQEVVMPQSSLQWNLFIRIRGQKLRYHVTPSWPSASQIDAFCMFQTDVARDAFTYTSLPVVLPFSIYAQLLSV